MPLSRLLKLNKPELPHFIVGFISSIAIGITFSLFAIIFGELFDVNINELFLKYTIIFNQMIYF